MISQKADETHQVSYHQPSDISITSWIADINADQGYSSYDVLNGFPSWPRSLLHKGEYATKQARRARKKEKEKYSLEDCLLYRMHWTY